MPRRTNKQLIARLREISQLQSFGGGGTISVKGHDIFSRDADGFSGRTEDFVREQTRMYRDTYLAPLLDEVEQRLCGK